MLFLSTPIVIASASLKVVVILIYRIGNVQVDKIRQGPSEKMSTLNGKNVLPRRANYAFLE